MKAEKLKFDDFIAFRDFSNDILSEIVREGERDLDARLSTANASDQRALGVFGFQITLAIAVCGGLAALAAKNPVDKVLIGLAIMLLFGLVVAAFYSYLSVLPKPFCYPGNRPDSWFVKDWKLPPKTECTADVRLARVEQCYCIYSAIYDNTKVMERNAKLLINSLAVMMVAIIFPAICYLLFFGFELASLN